MPRRTNPWVEELGQNKNKTPNQNKPPFFQGLALETVCPVSFPDGLWDMVYSIVSSGRGILLFRGSPSRILEIAKKLKRSKPYIVAYSPLLWSNPYSVSTG